MTPGVARDPSGDPDRPLVGVDLDPPADRDRRCRVRVAEVVVFDLDFGHTNPTAPVPVGGRVEVDTDERAVRFP